MATQAQSMQRSSALFSVVTQAAFLPFQLQENPNGLVTIREFPALTCNFEGERVTMVQSGLSVGALYTVGFQLLCMRQVFRFQPQFVATRSSL